MFNFDLVLSSKLSSLWERMPLDFIRFTSETEVMKANKAGSYPRFINQDARSGDSRKYTFSLVPISDMYWDRALIGRSGPDMLVSGNRSQTIYFRRNLPVDTCRCDEFHQSLSGIDGETR